MAEIFEQKDGCCRPRIICDACQQPINNFRGAMVVYEEASDEDHSELTRVMHCHKDEPCQDTARQMAKQRGCNGPWDELGNHLVWMAANAGMSLDDLSEKHEYLSQRDMIPVITNETF